MIKDYPGSKGGAGVWQRIICEMPPHQTYIEPFLGSGAVLQKKLAAANTFGVDASSKVVRAWSVTKADRLTPEAARPAELAINVLHGDARGIVPRLVTENPGPVLVYADPPYPRETRSCQRDYYEFELSHSDHVEILAMLKALPCLVIVSSYWSELYGEALRDWRTVQIPTVNRRGKKVIEWLWCNFPEPTTLHDPRFVGSNYRERWRIQKKLRNWQRMLEAMPPLERQKIAELALHGATPRTVLRDLRDVEGAAVRNDSNGVADRRHAPDTALGSREPGQSRLVLSLFPGAGLLDRGCEQAGFTVVRGPDTLFGQDIRGFHFPSSIVAGVVGGPPCQDFSRARRRPPTGHGLEMLNEFRRVVIEAQPDWWLCENVPGVPDIHIAGYVTQRFNVFASEFGVAQKRNRSFQFGSRDGKKIVLLRGTQSQNLKPAVLAKDKDGRRRTFADRCELQGLPRNFNLPGLSREAKNRAVGNGVPVPVAYAVACAIRDRASSVTVPLCECDCGRQVTGRQRTATAACRKRMERRRRSMSHAPGAVTSAAASQAPDCEKASFGGFEAKSDAHN